MKTDVVQSVRWCRSPKSRSWLDELQTPLLASMPLLNLDTSAGRAAHTHTHPHPHPHSLTHSHTHSLSVVSSSKQNV
eukprot:295834-Amphidinium_carterae.1